MAKPPPMPPTERPWPAHDPSNGVGWPMMAGLAVVVVVLVVGILWYGWRPVLL